MSYDPRFRRTKLVVTVGPSSASADNLRRLIEAGVDVFRINSSHGPPATRAAWMQLIREVRGEAGKHAALLVDLQGPRIRVGDLAEPRVLEQGTEVVFAPEGMAGASDIPTTYAELADDVSTGSRILLNDGLLEVTVGAVTGRKVRGTVMHGGILQSHKGINLPGVNVSAPAVTEKDREDIALALENGADYIAISFVRRASDIEEVRQLVPPSVRLVAKIEKAAALADLPRIIEVSDAIMVARGDLGVELPFEQVPLVQKRVIIAANQQGCPVITATQMLESMVQNPRPTRAEASDVANAILDGTDAVMLSAETAIGSYPVAAAEAMIRIIHEIERSGLGDAGLIGQHGPRDSGEAQSVEDAIAMATCTAAELMNAPLIVCFTKSGFTPRKISSHRPSVPILGLSTEASTCRHLSLVWGVLPELADRVPNYGAMLDVAREALVARGLLKPGDRIIVTAGVPFEVAGTTNLLKVETV